MSNAEQRYVGSRDALGSLGLAVDAGSWCATSATPDAVVAVTMLLAQPDPKTALFTA